MTPSQQIAINRIIINAAQHALVVKYGKTWDIRNGIGESPEVQEAYTCRQGLVRRLAGERAGKLAEALAFFFDEEELTALAQPADPLGCET